MNEPSCRPLQARRGPLAGVRVVELAGIGPGPMCAMLLADLGATVLRIDRTSEADLGMKRPLRYSLTLRGREAVAVDLKSPTAVDFVLCLAERADGLVDPFRPGVLERLGLGPDTCLARNPRLVYGRITGWGQDGPLAPVAGHDLNYIALAGVLDAIGREGQPPTPPLNLVADFGGGALYLAFGMVSAMLEARSSGLGQVVDTAMFEGSAHLATLFHGMRAAGQWSTERGTHYLSGAAPWYDSYACADGKWLSVAAIEDRFWIVFAKGIALDAAALPNRDDPANWPALRERIAERLRARTRDEWEQVFAGADACVAPVLDLEEATRHPHAVARGTFVEIEGVMQPAPVPRFSRTPPDLPRAPQPSDNARPEQSLAGWMEAAEVREWQERGVLALRK